jgi:hypothetical protein
LRKEEIIILGLAFWECTTLLSIVQNIYWFSEASGEYLPWGNMGEYVFHFKVKYSIDRSIGCMRSSLKQSIK